MNKDQVRNKINNILLEEKIDAELAEKANSFIDNFDDAKDKPDVKIDNEVLLLEWKLGTNDDNFNVIVFPNDNSICFSYDSELDA